MNSDHYIKNLHVKNIGPFGSLDIQFSPGVNIIIGTNASGKTSILKCLCYCFGPNHMEYLRFRKDAEYWCEVQTTDPFRSGASSVVNTDQQYRQINVSAWGGIPSTNVHSVFRPHDQIPYNIFALGANRYFDYQRLSGMQREAKGLERKKYYKQHNIDFLSSPNLPNIKQWMINRYFSIEKSWAKTEAENWSYILSKLPVISPRNAVIEFSRIERDLEPIFSVNGRECYLEELSSGFKSFLSIIFSIIDWGEGVNENEDALIQNLKGSVLIDEIDTHLHPEWQVTIMSSLNVLFPKLQFIVTSHSPLVIASAKNNQVIKIPSFSDDLNLKPEEKNYKGWQIDYILEDLMECINYNEISSKELFIEIDKAIDEKNLEKFEEELKKLSSVLSAKDPIIRFYEIKRSSLYLSN